MEDSEIVALYWAREEAAIEHTAQKYGAYLEKIACNILSDREDSQECANDTYLRAWNSMPTQRPSALTTYLGRIVRGLAIDRYRRRTSAKRAPSTYALSLSELGEICGGEEPETVLQQKHLEEAIGAFVRGLSPEARTLFLGRYYYFDSLKEVAAYCGMREAKAKSLLHRTRQKLRIYLEQEGFSL